MKLKLVSLRAVLLKVLYYPLVFITFQNQYENKLNWPHGSYCDWLHKDFQWPRKTKVHNALVAFKQKKIEKKIIEKPK